MIEAALQTRSWPREDDRTAQSGGVIEVRSLPPEDWVAWDLLVQASPASGMLQSTTWARFRVAMGIEVFPVGVYEGERLIGGAMVEKIVVEDAMSYLYIGEGPVLPYDHPEAATMFEKLIATIDELVDRRGKVRTTHLRVEPRLSRVPGFFKSLRKSPWNYQPRSVWVVDLGGTEEALLGRMRSDGPFEIRKAGRLGVRIASTGLAEGLEHFLPLYDQVRERQGFEGPPHGYYEDLFGTLEQSGQGICYIAICDGEVVAVDLNVAFGDRFIGLAAATSSAHREKKAHTLCKWELMRHGRSLGCREYDLGGVAPDPEDPAHPWHGVTRFKRKLGGRKVDLIGAFDHVYMPRRYRSWLVESGEAGR